MELKAIYRNKEAGARIKAYRKGKGWTQKDLGDQLDVSRQLVWQWEKGTGKGPTMFDLNRMCELFDCDFRYLIGEMEEKTEKTHDLHELTGLNEAACDALQRISRNRGVLKFNIAFQIVEWLLSTSATEVCPLDFIAMPDFMVDKYKQNDIPIIPESILLHIASPISRIVSDIPFFINKPRLTDTLEAKRFQVHKRLEQFGDYILQKEMKGIGK